MWHPPENDLIREHTPAKVNQTIDEATKLAYERVHRASEIRERLAKLDREWHIDRALIATFAVLGSITASNAIRSVWRRKPVSGWRMLFWTQMGFLLHHAVRGWCPPVSVLRRLGFRSANEIAAERAALEKKLSGVP
jgi:hypothetical protein